MKRFAGMGFRSATLLALLAVVLASSQQRTASVEAAQPAAEKPAAAAATAHTYVGTPTGAAESARIGIVIDDKNFLVYACSQDATFNNDHAAWFKGTRTGDKIEATNGDRTLKATIAADKVTGEIKSGAATITFTAKNCDNHMCAGLYRAEDTDDGKTVVFGWVVDEDGNVAGGQQRQGAKGTGVVPNNGVLNGLNGQVNQKAQPVNGQRVQNPANLPVGAKKKFTPERRKEFMDRVIAKSPQGGNAVMGMTVHLMKRFNSGARPEGEIEQAAFAKLRTLPKQAVVDYVKNMESLPAAAKDRLLGTQFKNMDIKQAVTRQIAKTAIDKSPFAGVKSGPPQPAGDVPKVKRITVTELKCFQNTSGLAGEARDEIFAVYAVSSNGILFAKTTAPITGVKSGDEKNFPQADRVVFPPAEQPQLTSAEDVFVVAKLFEHDGNINLIAGLVKAAVDIGLVAVAALVPGAQFAAGFIAPANILIDQVAAAIPDAQPLGEDAFRATVLGDIKKVDSNTNVNELKFKRDDRAGPAPFDYRLRQLDVDN